MPRKTSVSGAAAIAAAAQAATVAATSNATPGTTTDDPTHHAGSSADTMGLAQFELPKALITRIAKASEMPLALVKSSTIFINYLAALSHDAAHEKNQKTISATHVLEAIKELGWDDQQALNKYLAVQLRAFRKNVQDKKNGLKPTTTTSKPNSAAAAVPLAVPLVGAEEPTRKTRATRKTAAAAQQAENEVEAASQIAEANGARPLGEEEDDAEQDPYLTEEEDEDQVDLGPEEEEEDVVDDEEELDEEVDDAKGLDDDPMQDDD
ncbi:BQ2448_6742 [Microbotryum intermedium]|uniref:DNA polymerase epsilon subunit D n=1 Tax=Microbotryum intermedium TaxID=269621 RepID=A0A238FKI6_9BASI|nr:BQ2448_6742 [Microbotryum intermedium]